MDPKVTNLMGLVNAKNINSFKTMATYKSVEKLKEKYSNSTVEDYVWRLLRVIKTKSKFPPKMITLYNSLWISVGGKPK